MSEKFKFRVVEDRQESIDTLSDKAASGIPVTKTPHVGNWRPDNIIWIDEHIQNLAYDRTFGSKDSNFHPHGIIQSGFFKQMVPSNMLTTHSPIKDLHMNTLKEMFPNTKLETFASWVRAHRHHVEVVLDLLGEKSVKMGLWKRYVNKDGKTELKTPISYKAVKKEGIFGIDSDDRGWIWSNELNVILLSVIDSLIHDTITEVWHVSGPDMFNYIGKMHKALQDIYAEIANKNGIPEELTMHLHVAGFYNRLMVPLPFKKNLDEVVELLLELGRVNKEKNNAFKRKQNGERVNVTAYIDKVNKVFEDFVESVDTIKEFIFYKMQRPKNGMPKQICPTYFSQYDVAKYGGVYIHPLARSLSSAEIKEVYDLLLKAEIRLSK